MDVLETTTKTSYKLIFYVESNKVERIISNDIVTKYSNSWCLLIMLKDLSNDNKPAIVIGDTSNTSDVIIDNAHNIIPLATFDIIMECLLTNNFWDLHLTKLTLLSQQGIITSLALVDLYNESLTSADLIFACEIAEFELNSKINHIEFNNVHHYKQAYKYLNSNPNVLSYQIVTYNVSITIIFINCIPVKLSYDYNKTDLCYLDIEDRFDLIDGISIFGAETVTLYVNNLSPVGNMGLTNHNYSTDLSGIKDRKYKPHKLRDDKELLNRLTDQTIFARGDSGRDGCQGMRGRTYHSQYYKSIKFQPPSNCSLLDKDTEAKAMNILDRIYSRLQLKDIAVTIDCGSDTKIEIYNGYIKI